MRVKEKFQKWFKSIFLNYKKLGRSVFAWLIVGFIIIPIGAYQWIVQPNSPYRVQQLHTVSANAFRMESICERRELKSGWSNAVLEKQYYFPEGVAAVKPKIIQNLQKDGWIADITSEEHTMAFYNDEIILHLKEVDSHRLLISAERLKHRIRGVV